MRMATLPSCRLRPVIVQLHSEFAFASVMFAFSVRIRPGTVRSISAQSVTVHTSIENSWVFTYMSSSRLWIEYAR